MRRALLLAVGSTGLVATSALAQGPRTRDSAGVHIVENASRLHAPVTLMVGTTPIVDIGGLKDNPDDELDPHNGYPNAITLSDGTLVVTDNSRIRYYDPHGKQIARFGRPGAGPGEFRQVTGICSTRGDTVIASDPHNSRITVLDHRGSLVRMLAIPAVDLERSACFADGTFLRSEVHRSDNTLVLTRLRLDSTIASRLGASWMGTSDLFIRVPATMVAAGTHLYLGDPRQSEVRIRDVNGKEASIIRTADPIENTTAAERDAMKPLMSIVTDDKNAQDRYNDKLRTAPHPMTWPSYDRIAVDPDGHLWIEDFRHTRKSPDNWTGFDANGKMIGRFTFPADTMLSMPYILGFARSGVIVRHYDDDGALHLAIYPLVAARRP